MHGCFHQPFGDYANSSIQIREGFIVDEDEEDGEDEDAEERRAKRKREHRDREEEHQLDEDDYDLVGEQFADKPKPQSQVR